MEIRRAEREESCDRTKQISSLEKIFEELLPGNNDMSLYLINFNIYN